MNQEEKCRKEVAREENKRRLIFFFFYIKISLGQWFYRIMWCQCYCRGSSASEKRDHVGSILCWDPSILFCLNEGSPKDIRASQGRGSAAKSQHMMASDRKDSISVCKFSWYHTPKQLQGEQENISQCTLGQFSCDFSCYFLSLDA